MTMEERGQYITILAVMHQKGRLDEKTIRFLVGNISDNLRSKFTIGKDGLWSNERLEIEVGKRRAFVQSRRDNGSKGGRPKKKPNVKPSGLAMANLTENEDVNGNVNENEGSNAGAENPNEIPDLKAITEQFKSTLASMDLPPDAMNVDELAIKFESYYASQGWRKPSGIFIYKWRPLVTQWVMKEKGKIKVPTNHKKRSWD